jgi:DEAD/DEAH box helicase domain-containing protein
MNLSLDFGPRQPALSGGTQQGASAALAVFERIMQEPDAPVRAIHHQPPRPADLCDFPSGLATRLRAACAELGIHSLYSHQATAIEHVIAGKNVVVVTPTASGKTLCYNLPVLDGIISNSAHRAFYLFPTKALAEDQRHELDNWMRVISGKGACYCYDGDTPQDARRSIREKANVILTNPDMLHAGILPHHTKWAKCLENLRYFVIDELHFYRGVYGSHLANLVRRLKRICNFYGSKPQFICCSATIGNPKDLAERIIGEPCELVDNNGAPSGSKYFIFYNPPVVNRQLGIRRSYLHESRRIALEFISKRLQSLVFANNRLAMEVLLTYLKEACAAIPFSDMAIRGYRGGYLPKERREVERRLRNGEIRAVVATNALELGLDIGSLDAVVLAGYPGTIASTCQRAGRAGRRNEAAITVLVATSAPLDQYVVEHPEYFFGQAPERAYINPDNLEILLNHLKCAAFELPIAENERFGPHEIQELCAFLADELKLLYRSGTSWHWVSDSYPADSVSLRSVTSDNFIVVDVTNDHSVIAEVNFPSALTTLHEKAIYLHDSRQYQVERLDYDGRKAFVRRVDSDYFTDAIVYTQVKEMALFESASVRDALAAHGEVRLKTQVTGFKKIKFYTLENVGAGQLSLPEQEMHTTAFWVHLNSTFLSQLKLSSLEIQNGLVACANLMKTIATLLLMCDDHDLGVSITEHVAAARAWEPDLFLYDCYPGGIGHSQPLFEMRYKVFAGALELLESCPCSAGCPSCVGPEGEVSENAKSHARAVLDALLATLSAPTRPAARLEPRTESRSAGERG